MTLIIDAILIVLIAITGLILTILTLFIYFKILSKLNNISEYEVMSSFQDMDKKELNNLVLTIPTLVMCILVYFCFTYN
jgi:ribose/xylose/arabinose/galactoside ABC-type transport system permease subunit